jgi:hypothetical protein
LDETASVKLATSVSFRRAMDALKNGRSNGAALVTEYLDLLASELEKFRIAPEGSEYDEEFLASITNFLPYGNEFIETRRGERSRRAQRKRSFNTKRNELSRILRG